MEKITIFLIRIKNCKNPLFFWYNESIGKEFECVVRKTGSLFWINPFGKVFTTVKNINDLGTGNVLPEDCEVISKREVTMDYFLALDPTEK